MGIIEVDVTSPLIPNFARHALTVDLTEDTSPVITKHPLPPKPLAILKSTMLTLEAFTAVSAAIIAVKAEIVSIANCLGFAELSYSSNSENFFTNIVKDMCVD